MEDIHWKKYAERFRTFQRWIADDPRSVPSLTICIPAYAEPDLMKTLESIVHCQPIPVPVEVLIGFNEDERMDEGQKILHRDSLEATRKFVAAHSRPGFEIHALWLDKIEPVKWGVGWARKLIMDEAARRLAPAGILVSLDADATVADNYLRAIWTYFETHPDTMAVSIFVEHPFQDLSSDERESIITYELHLRYLVHAQRWAGHPYAYQTFGSAMAVRRSAYLQQGGMNTRQAGEDFYFLQKFIETESFSEIRDTTVYPSSRISLRVPFGTGKAMYQMQQERTGWLSPDFESFELIKPLFQQLPLLYELLMMPPEGMDQEKIYVALTLSKEVQTFLNSIDFYSTCRTIVGHTATYRSFEKRFFRFFNAFMMIRYLHYMRDHFFPNVETQSAVVKLIAANGWPAPESLSQEALLQTLRRIDRNGSGG